MSSAERFQSGKTGVVMRSLYVDFERRIGSPLLSASRSTAGSLMSVIEHSFTPDLKSIDFFLRSFRD